MRFKKGDKVVCVQEWDEHNRRGYGIHLGRTFTVRGTFCLTNPLSGKKYQMVRLKGFSKATINACHFIKAKEQI